MPMSSSFASQWATTRSSASAATRFQADSASGWQSPGRYSSIHRCSSSTTRRAPLDVQVEQHIHAALRELMANRTTLIIAHRLATITLADRVVLVDGGHVVAMGRHRDLLEHEPRYSELLARIAEGVGEETA